MIEFKCKLVRSAFALDVDFSVEEGSIYGLYGPSAAGKSTILRVIAGFEEHFEQAYLKVGHRVMLDVDASRRRRHILPSWQRGIAMVEQGALLFPHLTVGDNIAYSGKTRVEDPWLQSLVDKFGLFDYLGARPSDLSGGLSQRAVLARAMASRPRVLLLDEPFSALDSPLRRLLQDAILDWRQEQGATVILVTHQLAEAQRMADEMGVLVDGRILQQTTPEHLMAAPASWEVASRLGYTHRMQDSGGRTFALHPNRVALGSQGELGPVLSGSVIERFLHEGERRVAVEISEIAGARRSLVVEISVPAVADIHKGDELTFTVVQPVWLDETPFCQ